MNQWMTIAHLPSFWTQNWPYLAALVIAVTAGWYWLAPYIGRASERRTRQRLDTLPVDHLLVVPGQTQEQYDERRTAWARHLGVERTQTTIIILAMLAPVVLLLAHDSAHGQTVTTQIVDYVEATTDLTVQSPVHLDKDSATFTAAHVNGTAADVTVTWADVNAHSYRSSGQLPAGFSPFTIHVHDKDATQH